MRNIFTNTIFNLKNIFIFFLNDNPNSVCFFNENETTYEYLKHYIKNNKKKKIIFFSLKKFEFSLDKNVVIILLNQKFFIELLFLLLRSKYVYSTTPGLGFTLFKRSYASKFTKYIYIQHSPVSLTMAYDKNAFINFDAVQAINKFQFNEINEINKIHKKKIKAFKSKYKFLNYNIIKQEHNLLIAPTWKTDFYSSGFYLILLNKLIEKKIDFIFRPHYMSLKKNEIKVDQLSFLKNKVDFSSKVELFKYKNLISDWSGIFLEFAICNNKKPHLFYSKKKILNTNYNNIFKNSSLEEYARKKICFNYNFNEIDLLIDNLGKDNVADNIEVREFIENNFY
jgi:hypothetical protein